MCAWMAGWRQDHVLLMAVMGATWGHEEMGQMENGVYRMEVEILAGLGKKMMYFFSSYCQVNEVGDVDGMDDGGGTM